jgi:hypothetical protein
MPPWPLTWMPLLDRNNINLGLVLPVLTARISVER